MEVQGGLGEASGFYLYCLFSGECPRLTGIMGIEGREELFVLTCRDLNALVSYVPLDEYNEESLSQRLKDPEWMASRVQRHQEVIQHIINLNPAVPIKFCTIFKAKEKILELLRGHYQELCSFLEFIKGKEEWGLKVYAQEGLLREAAARSCPALPELDEKLATVMPGEAYLLKKKKEGLVREQVEGLLDKLADEIYQQLHSWCDDSRRNRPWSKEASGREEEMLLNVALLLKKRDVEEFKAHLSRLADNYESYRLLFEISGPWPPYNFCPELMANREKER